MASLMANIVLGTLGTGAVVSAIAVPLTLAKNNTEQKQIENRGLDSGKQLEEQRDSTQVQRTHAPKKPEQWKEKDFQENCYGNFLKQENKGEMIVCLDKSQDKEKPNLLFYLHWIGSGNDEFTPIEEINITDLQVSFELKKQSTKTLVVQRSDSEGLTVLQIPRSQFHQLKDRCGGSYSDGENYQLKCKHWNGVEYNRQATKINLISEKLN